MREGDEGATAAPRRGVLPLGSDERGGEHQPAGADCGDERERKRENGAHGMPPVNGFVRFLAGLTPHRLT